MMGQLPPERITPDMVFEHVGLDFAGMLYLKRGSTHKPVIVKSYVCIFVSMSVKAVHLSLFLTFLPNHSSPVSEDLLLK